MRITFICLILLSCYTKALRADTISYCHVFLNHEKIGDFAIYESFPAEVVIQLSSIKETDTLIIKYYSDAPCFKCACNVSIGNENDSIIMSKIAYGERSPLSIGLYPFLKYKANLHNQRFSVNYNQEPYKASNNSYRIFYIKFE